MNVKRLIQSAMILSFLALSGQTSFARESFALLEEGMEPGAQYLVSSDMSTDDKSAMSSLAHISKEVRHELVTLPYYNLFDWLEYEVHSDGTVVLRGQVVRPTTKSDAGGRVKKIEGVASVENQIEVLPLSPNDDRLRIALFRSIYGYGSPLFRYGVQVVPSIHLIVKNGRATLKGVVATKADRDVANIRAKTVSGLFEVKNELQVEEDMAQ